MITIAAAVAASAAKVLRKAEIPMAPPVAHYLAVTVIGVETQLPFTSTVVFHSNLTGSGARGARG